MARSYSRDIEKAITDKLKSAVSGLNVFLQMIDTERAENYYTESSVLDGNIQPVDFKNQVPSVHIFVKNMVRDNGGGLGETADSMTAIYTVSVDILQKFSNPTRGLNIMNNYEEALTRCLHLQSLSGITQIILKNTQKSQISQKNDMMYFDVLESEFLVRIN